MTVPGQNNNVNTEFDAKRDKRGRVVHAHVATAAEQLRDIHIGDSTLPRDWPDSFTGSDPLPTGLRKYRYATTRWKGSNAPKPPK